MARPGVSDEWNRAVRALAPRDLICYAVRLEHPDLPEPARIVNDVRPAVVDGHRYAKTRFGLRLADDVEGQAPRAELSVVNIGRELTQWVERANATAEGATATLLELLRNRDPASEAATVEWSTTMDVAHCGAGELVTVRLGYDATLNQPAVRVRHDPRTSPGLF